MYRYLALLGVGIIFGMFGVMIHYNSLMFGDYAQVAIRNGAALFLLLPIIFYKKISFRLTKKEWCWLLFYAAVTVFAFTFATLAYLNAEIKTVLAVRYLTTIVVSLLISVVFIKEHITKSNVTALLLATVGIGVFGYPFGSFFSDGVLYSFLTAFAFVLASYIIKRVTITPEVLMAAEFAAVAVFVGIFIALAGAPVITEYNQLAMISMYVFIPLLIVVTYLIIYGFRKTNFNLANIVMTSEIIFGLMFGYWLLGQTVTPLELTGIALIFMAVVLPNVIAFKTKTNVKR